jgi:hypothetical protein
MNPKLKTMLNNPFMSSYIECIFFTEYDTINHKSTTDLADESLERIFKDCQSFLHQANARIQADRPSTNCSKASQGGHDFWLTRNHHGAGFWDGDWPRYGDELTAIAQSFPQLNAHIGNDGLIYLA